MGQVNMVQNWKQIIWQKIKNYSFPTFHLDISPVYYPTHLLLRKTEGKFMLKKDVG